MNLVLQQDKNGARLARTTRIAAARARCQRAIFAANDLAGWRRFSRGEAGSSFTVSQTHFSSMSSMR
jgi:hypothetical protein